MSSDNDEVLELSKDQHREVVAVIEKMETTMRAGFNDIKLIPTASLFMLIVSYFFWIDKVPLYVWVPMIVYGMTPFFGDNVIKALLRNIGAGRRDG